MDRYKVLKALGDGTYGSVMRAQNKSTGETVAIKKFKQKYRSWDECIKLREIASLRKLIHPNIVKLKEVIRENDELHLVFDHMDSNLYEYLKGQVRSLPENKCRNLMFQILQALSHVHKNGYFHRDMKPENLLIRGDLCKLADFGLAREIRARPPFTDYVSTRWYRAPEVLLRNSVYNSPIDLFACGAIMAEIYTRRPLLPGSSESDQLYKTCSVLGTPSQTAWPEGHKLASRLGFRWPQFSPTKLETLVPNCGKEGIELMYGQMEWDPAKRFSASKCLSHPYFDTGMPGNGQFDNLSLASGQQAQQPSAASNAPSSHPKVQAAQKEQFPGNFLLNNLNATKGSALNSTKGSIHGSRPNTGPRGAGAAPSAGKRNSKDGGTPSGQLPPVLPPGFGAPAPNFGAPGNVLQPMQGGGLPGGLPPVHGGREGTNSGHKSGGPSRYLKMARYQPGMQQQVQPGSAAAPQPNAGGLGAPGGAMKLPPVGGGAVRRDNLLDGVERRNPGVFGGAAARMLHK